MRFLPRFQFPRFREANEAHPWGIAAGAPAPPRQGRPPGQPEAFAPGPGAAGRVESRPGCAVEFRWSARSVHVGPVEAASTPG